MTDSSPVIDLGVAPDRIDATDLLDDIEFLVARVRAIGSLSARHALEPHGLRVRSYAVLSLVCGAVSPTQRDVAEFLFLDPSQVVAVVDELQTLGYVERAQDPRDRRANIIRGTETGQAAYAKAKKSVIAARDETILKNLSQEERQSLTQLLLKVAF
ncbi:MarR family winged helix-turn-helix transcriptional regulator [Salinibacterium hongtaonis]|uniref:MarR family winged helix-turn-helix transcriptional regulator n=1 Tax=Homoserinimonas hongtaonis TaxID=2079791 RepID=UPI000D3C9F69|nr:MarR family winged helix-turn-helix transcriptional regulator [Salinibacterium hongtaonis]AWB89630.1 MarR family transcriptional regulator [Salinibacterium hongtaonis]